MTEHRKASAGLAFLALVVAATVALLVMSIGSGSVAGQTDTPVRADTSGYVNPWAAGDAAVLRYFAELGRQQHLARTP